MCGRFTLTAADPAALRARFGFEEERLEVRPRFNAAPGDHVLAVVHADGSLRGELLRWGLVPHWAEDPDALGNRTINARAETVAEKPAYREAFARRRCLVVADGFFEWSGGMPYWITRADGEPFGFAGLWATWRPHGAEELPPLRSCAIVTTQASPALSALHPRMPVMLERSAEAAWTDPATPPEVLHALLRPFEATTHRPVSRVVNDARHDAPDCLDPPEQAALF